MVLPLPINYQALIDSVGYYPGADEGRLLYQSNTDNTKPTGKGEAFKHAYTSATLAYDYGSGIAQIGGDSNEIGNPPAAAEDTYRDLWNNNVGRQIGDYVRQNNLPRSYINDLIVQSYQDGRLILAACRTWDE